MCYITVIWHRTNLKNCQIAREMYLPGSVSTHAHGVIRSSDQSLMVDPLSYFFVPSLLQRLWYVLVCLWDGAYK